MALENTPERRMRRRWIRTGLVAVGVACLAAPLVAAPAQAAPASAFGAATVADDQDRVATPRTVITTDPELDDLNSMLRMLLYSNDLDIAGLVYSASQHHYEGDPEAGIAPFRWPDPSSVFHIDEAVNAYEQVYPNLVAHDSTYPTPDHLRSLIKWGNVKNVGEMAEDTEGSDFIKQILLDDEPGQVFLQAWGGPNTIARALKSIQDEYQGTPEWDAIHDKITQKVVLTSFGQQDTTFRDYIRPNWPDLEHREVATSIWGYGARGSALPEWQKYLSPEWTRANVSDVGPIGESYRVWGDGKQMAAGFDDEDYFGLSGYTADELRAMGYGVWTPPQPKDAWISEGDSSNFALLIDNGLRNWEDPTYGGWGGRQALNPADPYQWRNRGVTDLYNGAPRNDYSAGRWFEDFQLDFAARMQWSVTPTFDGANHAPEVSLADGVDLEAQVGAPVTLNAEAVDPDGDAVSYRWYQYAEADTYAGAIAIDGADSAQATFTVPADAPVGSTIHVILEVQDDGTPALKHYQRAVVTVTADKTRPEVSLAAPTSAGPSQAIGLKVDASDGGGLARIVANIYQGSTLVKSTQTAQNGALSGSHEATVNLPSGEYTIKYNAQDLAGNISKTSTFAVTVDATAPTVTVKDGSSFTVGSASAGYDLVSFKLYDAKKIDKVTINGVVKDLSDNAWSDVNFVKPGVFGAVKGANTLVVFDVAGNQTTVPFTLK
ncbi:nucleoside hydrolase-like domain-containing protein [Agromyces sp. LHK192]|uniref:nucleoside hydrolase-like domain-containing protein n=1 Tax=Agromyces sp. LHK192 TaxID=2498704 RepID=UPI001F0CC675|nr:nucleoside hydrolase-like domain-containing protein [Agromyces sp. LHK192]